MRVDIEEAFKKLFQGEILAAQIENGRFLLGRNSGTDTYYLTEQFSNGDLEYVRQRVSIERLAEVFWVLEKEFCPICGEKVSERGARQLADPLIANTVIDRLNLADSWLFYRKEYIIHLSCQEKYLAEEKRQERIWNKQIELYEKVSRIACPHCGETDAISLYPVRYNWWGDPIPGWLCDSCGKEISAKWLMTEIRRNNGTMALSSN